MTRWVLIQTDLWSRIRNYLIDEIELSVIQLDKRPRPTDPGVRIFTCSAFLLFTCLSCKHKSWTTVNGTVQFTYIYTRTQLSYFPKIYKQACVQCFRLGVIRADQLQARQLFYELADCVNKLIDGLEIRKRIHIWTQIGTRSGRHRSELCEACRLKRCVYADKKKYEKENRKRETNAGPGFEIDVITF